MYKNLLCFKLVQYIIPLFPEYEKTISWINLAFYFNTQWCQVHIQEIPTLMIHLYNMYESTWYMYKQWMNFDTRWIIHVQRGHIDRHGGKKYMVYLLIFKCQHWNTISIKKKLMSLPLAVSIFMLFMGNHISFV